MAYPDGNANKPIASDATQKDLVPFGRPGFFAKDIRVMSNGLQGEKRTLKFTLQMLE